MLFWTMLKHVVLCRHHSKGVPSHRHGAFLPPLGLQTYIDISISTSIYLFIDISTICAHTLALHGLFLYLSIALLFSIYIYLHIHVYRHR